MLSKKTLFIFIISLFFILSPISFASETCIEGTDCLESINENTYNIEQSLGDLNTYLSVDSDNPIVLLSLEQYEEYNNNMSDLLQVYGIFSGLVLFSLFFQIGLFLYKR